MNLSPHYRRVALFDSPVDVTPGSSNRPGGYHAFYTFSQGPLRYSALFQRIVTDDQPQDRSYYFMFRLYEIAGDERSFARYLSQIRGVPVTPTQARATMSRALTRPYGIHGFAGTRGSVAIMGHLIRIFQEFVSSYQPDMVKFSSEEESRTRLYRALVRKFSGRNRVEIENSGGSAEFKIYFGEDA